MINLFTLSQTVRHCLKLDVLSPAFLSLVICVVISGCAPSIPQDRTQPSGIQQEKMRTQTTLGDSHQEDRHSVTSLAASPYEGEKVAAKLAESKVELDLARYKTIPDQAHGELEKLYPWNTKNGHHLIVTIEKDGVIAAGKASSYPSTQYTLGKIERGAEFVDFSPITGLVGYKDKGGVSVYSIPEQKVLATLTALPTRVTTLTFSPDGDSLLIGGADSMIYNWRFGAQLRNDDADKPERLIHRYTGSGSVPSALAYHPEGRVFFSGDWRGDLVGWQRYGTDRYEGKYDRNIGGQRFFTGRALRVRSRIGNGVGIDRLKVDETGQFLFVALQDGTLEMWKVKGMQHLATAKMHNGPIYSLSVSGPGEIIATAGKDGRAKIWQVTNFDTIIEETLGRRNRFKKKMKAARNMALNVNEVEPVPNADDSLANGEDPASSSAGRPETIKRKVKIYEIKLVKEHSIPGLITASFTDPTNVFAGDRSGRVVQIALDDLKVG